MRGKDLFGLKQKIGPVMFLVADRINWESWNWPTKKLAEMALNKTSPTMGQESPEEKDNGLNEVKPSPKPAPVPKYLRWLIICLVILLLIFIALAFKNNKFPFFPISAHTSQPTSTSSILTQKSFPTFTLSPTLTYTENPSDTFTLIPSSTPTNTITPIPTPVILFSDDFENGLSPYWIQLQGKAFVTNGQLAANAPAWLVVGDGTWTNIEIDYDGNFSYHADCSTDPFPPLYYTVMVGLRFQDLDNMVALKTGYIDFCWFTEANGKWVNVPGKGKGPWYGIWAKISILVEGDKFTALVNGKKSTSFADRTYSSGKVAFYLNKDTLIDNLKIIALP